MGVVFIPSEYVVQDLETSFEAQHLIHPCRRLVSHNERYRRTARYDGVMFLENVVIS
jgi:hypothetical protein